MIFSPMPELATGLTNIFIIISAACCLRSLPAKKELRDWRYFFIFLIIAAACGTLIHCLLLPVQIDFGLWLVFDLCVGPLLAALPLAGYRNSKGEPTRPYRLLCYGVGALTTLAMMMTLLLGFPQLELELELDLELGGQLQPALSFLLKQSLLHDQLQVMLKDQFNVAALIGILAVMAFTGLQLVKIRQRPGGLRPLLGISLVLLTGLPWVFATYSLRLGAVILNESSFIHLGVALALPLLRLGRKADLKGKLSLGRKADLKGELS